MVYGSELLIEDTPANNTSTSLSFFIIMVMRGTRTNHHWTLARLLLVFYTALLPGPGAVSFEVVPPSTSSPLSSLRQTPRSLSCFWTTTTTTAARQRQQSIIKPAFPCAAQVQGDTDDAPIFEEEEEDTALSSTTTPPNSSRQLWLDLRGTAIRPEEALAFLDEFLMHDEGVENHDDNDKNEKEYNEFSPKPTIIDLIDCILLPSDTFDEISPKGVALQQVDLLLVDNESNLVQDATTGQVKGAFIKNTNDDSSLTSLWMNPLYVLDLYNKGDWILFESSTAGSNDAQEELTEWVEQIGSLLQLLPATAAPHSLETPSGLVLPSYSSSSSLVAGDDLASSSSSSSSSPNKEASKQGGVGICCTTRQAVFGIDTLLEQVLSNVSSMESPESGILLLTTKSDDAASSLDMPITSALILPFELNLWRAVLELRKETR